jgi:hypothetical protein
MNYKLLLTVVALLLFTCTHAQNWELSRDENGIKVYKANSDSSRFKIIKVEALMSGTLQKLINVLKDVDNNKNWVYNTIHSYLVRNINENEFLYYAETHLPWPISNRDMVIRMHFGLDSVNKTLLVTATGEPDSLPGVNGKVRVRKFKGRWEVSSVGVNEIRILYFLELDPGGNLGAGLSNLFVAKGPFETFNNLSGMLKE